MNNNSKNVLLAIVTPLLALSSATAAPYTFTKIEVNTSNSVIGSTVPLTVTPNGVFGYYNDKAGNSHGFSYYSGNYQILDEPQATRLAPYSNTFGSYSTEVVGGFSDPTGTLSQYSGNYYGVNSARTQNGQFAVSDFGFYYNGTNFITIDNLTAPIGTTVVVGQSASNTVFGNYGDPRTATNLPTPSILHGFIWIYSAGAGTFSTIAAPGALSTELKGYDSVTKTYFGRFAYDSGIVGGFTFNGTAYKTYLRPQVGTRTIISTDVAAVTPNYVAGNFTDHTSAYSYPQDIAHGFFATANGYTTLDFPGSALGSTKVIGASGDIIVGTYLDTKNVMHGFTYSVPAASYLSFDFPGQVHGSFITGVSAGQIIGYAVDANYNNVNYSASAPTTSQSIQYADFYNRTYSSGVFSVSVSASSGLPVTVSTNVGVNAKVVGLSNVVSSNGITTQVSLQPYGVGNVTLNASQSGNSVYLPTSNSLTFPIAKGNQTINFPAISNSPVGSQIPLKASSSSSAAVTYTVSGPATLSGGTLTPTAAGSITVTANAAATVNYNAATPVSQTFIAFKAPQTITFPKISNTPVGTPITLNATSSSGLAVTYTVSGPAVIVSGKVTATNAGDVTITASAAESAKYQPATPVSQTFIAYKVQQSINFPQIPTLKVGSMVSLNATSSAQAPITYSITGPGILTKTSAGTKLTATAAGMISVTATAAETASVLPVSITQNILVTNQ